MTRSSQPFLLLHSRLDGQSLKCKGFAPPILDNDMLIFVHTALIIMTNPEHSELVTESIFHTLWVRTQAILINLRTLGGGVSL